MWLDRLLGTWDVAMRHVALPEPVTGRHRYERVLDGAFVMLQVTYDQPEFPDAIALLDEHTWHSFDVRGITRVFDLEPGPAGWAMVRRDPDFWQRSTTTFCGSDAMHGVGENSSDAGATWEHDFTLDCTRRQ
jgi:hypothetical protein